MVWYQRVDLWIEGANDTIRSTIHRVVAPPGLAAKDGLLPSRYSIPYVSSPLDLDHVIRLILHHILSFVHPYVFLLFHSTLHHPHA